MCCDEEFMPVEVAEMLATYRDLCKQRGFDWGEDFESSQRVLLQHLGRFAQDKVPNVGRSLEAMAHPLAYLAGFIPDSLPPDVAVVESTGIRMPDPLPFVGLGHPVKYHVFHLVESNGGLEALVDEAEVTAEDPYLDLGGVRYMAAEVIPYGQLTLRSDAVSRWSVVDSRGMGYFPVDNLHKFTWGNVPFFHGNNVVVDVPADDVSVRVARGCEFKPVDTVVRVLETEGSIVELNLERYYDAAAQGWYGADLHVHMNYVGDTVATPFDAARMQQGEGLHLMNLVAGNCQTSLIYDQEAFVQFLGQDLPWSEEDLVARWGFEYRNDLLGHFHALNPAVPPARYQTGHERSEHPHDWPPNSVAAVEARELGATVGYTHPVFQPMDADGSPAPVFSSEKAIRSTEAREIVADAALGLVDSIDLGGGSHIEGTEYLYHRMLGCGINLTPTVGTDTMLQNARMWPVSNPPGWFRAYAQLGDLPLSVQSWQQAMKAGKTFVTNGPWLTMSVDGVSLGGSLRLDGPATVTAKVTIAGEGIARLEIVGADGILAVRDLDPNARAAEYVFELTLTESTWLAAIGRGGEHAAVIGPQVYAHTSSVWAHIDGKEVARRSDAEWCLDWLDRLERFAGEFGRFDSIQQFADLVEVIDQARIFYEGILERADNGTPYRGHGIS